MQTKIINLSNSEILYLSSLCEENKNILCEDSFLKIKRIIDRAIISQQITESDLNSVFSLIESEFERQINQGQDNANTHSLYWYKLMAKEINPPDNMVFVLLERFLNHNRSRFFHMSISKSLSQSHNSQNILQNFKAKGR